MTRLYPATRASTMESTAGSSNGAYTPRSDGTLSFPFGPSDENSLAIRGRLEEVSSAGPSEEQLVPSIEEDLVFSSDDYFATTPQSSRTLRSSSIISRNESNIGNGVLRGTWATGVNPRNVRESGSASGQSEADVAARVEVVPSDPDIQATLLAPGQSPIAENSSNRVPSRRRSSSKVNSPPHDVCAEEPPQDRFHDPNFQQAFRDAKGLMADLVNVLGSSSLHIEPDSTIQRLHQKCGTLANFQCPSSRIVGFVGDSGVGKSSLLNSLLDINKLARTSNSGAACTCVVTEYHHHNSEDFAIETELFSMEEVMEQIIELLGSYRNYHLHNTELMGDERRDSEEKAQIAQDTFRAMFRGRLDQEEFLTDEPEDSVLRTLRSWIRDTIPSSIAGREIKSTLADCSALLMHRTSEQNLTRAPAIWPYVKKIRVFVKAHILSKGLVLVDLPGLRDLNSARRNITERYLLHCDEIFAICCIGRATTDVGVKTVFELARQVNLSEVGIVCTKSDDIRAEEAMNDWKGDISANVKRLMDTIAQDQQEINNIEEQLDDLEDELQSQRELMQNCKRAKRRLHANKFELKRYLINTRNTIVVGQLNEIYRDRLPQDGSRVFCVSNTDYWKHRNLPSDEALPFLTLSGIIALRKHCIAKVADSQLGIAKKYMSDNIPAMLRDLALWVQSGSGSTSAERRQAIRETLNAIETRLRRDLSGGLSLLSVTARTMKRDFRAHLYDTQNVSDWSQAAKSAATEWSTWSHATYSAFCRQYGDHCTERVGQHNWNAEAMERMVQALSTPWQSLLTVFRTSYRSNISSIEGLFEWAIRYVVVELPGASESTAILSQALILRQNLLTADVERAYHKFQAGLSTLGTDAFSAIRTSFIGKAMESAYRACNVEGGRGSDARRKAIINDKFKNSSVFDYIMREFNNGFTVLANNLQSDLAVAVEKHLGDVRRTLDILRNENAVTESELDPQFHRRVEAEVVAADDELRRIHAAAGI